MITDETDIDIEENDDLDDVEPIADEARLYEHFRVVHATASRRRPTPGSSWLTGSP